jgi:hypothetical protein
MTRGAEALNQLFAFPFGQLLALRRNSTDY